MRIFVLALLTVSLGFAQKVIVEFDQGVDFSRFHTFALGQAQLNSRNPALNSELVKKKLDDSIAHYLSAKGLTEVLNHADLNVRYHFGSARKKEIERYPAGWRGMGTRTVRIPYTEGTLVIDLRDPSLQALVWRSIAHEDKNDPEKIAGKLDEMVKKSISKYPPKPGSSH
jgi:hypothetical protein